MKKQNRVKLSLITCIMIAVFLALTGCGNSGSDNMQRPIITSVNPLEVKVGDQIRITGVGFGSTQKTSRITINGVPVTTISSWSDTVVLATVPTGATTGSVVITRSEIASSPGFVIVLWPKENPENTAISTASNSPQLVSDGAGGAVIVWQDYRNGAGSDIYAQRVNSSGAVMWTDGGIAVCTAANDQLSPQLVSDGAGGAVIVWVDYRSGTNYDIYAQRINSSGAVMLTNGGIAVCKAAKDQISSQFVSDGAGGAVIVWEDYRSGTNYDIYAQRINSSGVVMWTDGGIAVCTAANDQFSPQLVSNGAGGAVIVWQDERSGTGSDIYTQRVNSSGAVMWADDGIAVCTAANIQSSPQLVTDGAGGAVIVWPDYRSGTNNKIYAQRVNSSGAVMWTDDGSALSTAATNDQYSPQLVSDGAGGAVVVWSDGTIETGYDIYAQRVNSSGEVMWPVRGIAVCTAADGQYSPQLVSDGVDGAVIVWQDYRSSSNYDIYAQRLDSSGEVMWTDDGIAVCTAAKHQTLPQLVSDGVDGAVIVWQDYRSNTNYDIYAQGISSSRRM